MDIYQAISDFNEARLQKQLQLSIETAMRKGSVKYKEGQHLINLSVINGDNRSTSNGTPNSPLRKRATHDEDSGYLSVRDISKSIDSGVCLDTRDTEEEESEDEYDEVASADEDAHSSLNWEERRSVTPRKTAKRKTSPATSRVIIPHQLLTKSNSIKSKSLTRRRKGKEVSQPFDKPDYPDHDSNDLMTRSVMDTLDGWIDPLEKGSTPVVRRTGSKDTLLSSNPSVMRIGGTKEKHISHSRDDGPRSLEIFLSSPHRGSRKFPYKSYRPEPGDECVGIEKYNSGTSGNKGVLLLEVRRGDILGVSISIIGIIILIYIISQYIKNAML